MIREKYVIERIRSVWDSICGNKLSTPLSLKFIKPFLVFRSYYLDPRLQSGTPFQFRELNVFRHDGREIIHECRYRDEEGPDSRGVGRRGDSLFLRG